MHNKSVWTIMVATISIGWFKLIKINLIIIGNIKDSIIQDLFK
jgi:hypothetical protein